MYDVITAEMARAWTAKVKRQNVDYMEHAVGQHLYENIKEEVFMGRTSKKFLLIKGQYPNEYQFKLEYSTIHVTPDQFPYYEENIPKYFSKLGYNVETSYNANGTFNINIDWGEEE